jgi:hypothetical protein
MWLCGDVVDSVIWVHSSNDKASFSVYFFNNTDHMIRSCIHKALKSRGVDLKIPSRGGTIRYVLLLLLIAGDVPPDHQNVTRTQKQ